MTKNKACDKSGQKGGYMETLLDCLETVSENVLQVVENNQSITDQLEKLLEMYNEEKE
jgi:hypothetical protein